MTIREMTNPEVDEACAVEVMGWKSCIHSMQDRNDKTEHGWQTEKETKRKKYWLPTKNLEQAFMIVERMIDFDDKKRIHGFELFYDTVSFNAVFQNLDTNKRYSNMTMTSSAPRVICEAALMAVRERGEE